MTKSKSAIKKGRPTNTDRGLAPALVWIGAKIEVTTRDAIDAEAKCIGSTRNAVLRAWLAERAKEKRDEILKYIEEWQEHDA